MEIVELKKNDIKNLNCHMLEFDLPICATISEEGHIYIGFSNRIVGINLEFSPESTEKFYEVKSKKILTNFKKIGFSLIEDYDFNNDIETGQITQKEIYSLLFREDYTINAKSGFLFLYKKIEWSVMDYKNRKSFLAVLKSDGSLILYCEEHNRELVQFADLSGLYHSFYLSNIVHPDCLTSSGTISCNSWPNYQQTRDDFYIMDYSWSDLCYQDSFLLLALVTRANLVVVFCVPTNSCAPPTLVYHHRLSSELHGVVCRLRLCTVSESVCFLALAYTGSDKLLLQPYHISQEDDGTLNFNMQTHLKMLLTHKVPTDTVPQCMAWSCQHSLLVVGFCQDIFCVQVTLTQNRAAARSMALRLPPDASCLGAVSGLCFSSEWMYIANFEGSLFRVRCNVASVSALRLEHMQFPSSAGVCTINYLLPSRGGAHLYIVTGQGQTRRVAKKATKVPDVLVLRLVTDTNLSSRLSSDEIPLPLKLDLLEEARMLRWTSPAVFWAELGPLLDENPSAADMEIHELQLQRWLARMVGHSRTMMQVLCNPQMSLIHHPIPSKVQYLRLRSVETALLLMGACETLDDFCESSLARDSGDASLVLHMCTALRSLQQDADRLHLEMPLEAAEAEATRLLPGCLSSVVPGYVCYICGAAVTPTDSCGTDLLAELLCEAGHAQYRCTKTLRMISPLLCGCCELCGAPVTLKMKPDEEQPDPKKQRIEISEWRSEFNESGCVFCDGKIHGMIY